MSKETKQHAMENKMNKIDQLEKEIKELNEKISRLMKCMHLQDEAMMLMQGDINENKEDLKLAIDTIQELKLEMNKNQKDIKKYAKNEYMIGMTKHCEIEARLHNLETAYSCHMSVSLFWNDKEMMDYRENLFPGADKDTILKKMHKSYIGNNQYLIDNSTDGMISVNQVKELLRKIDNENVDRFGNVLKAEE